MCFFSTQSSPPPGVPWFQKAYIFTQWVPWSLFVLRPVPLELTSCPALNLTCYVWVVCPSGSQKEPESSPDCNYLHEGMPTEFWVCFREPRRGKEAPRNEQQGKAVITLGSLDSNENSGPSIKLGFQVNSEYFLHINMSQIVYILIFLNYWLLTWNLNWPGSPVFRQPYPGLKGKMVLLELRESWRPGGGWPCRSSGHGDTLVRNGAHGSDEQERKQSLLTLLVLWSSTDTSHWLNTIGDWGQESLVATIRGHCSPGANRWAKNHLSISLLEAFGDSPSFCFIPPVKIDS